MTDVPFAAVSGDASARPLIHSAPAYPRRRGDRVVKRREFIKRISGAASCGECAK